MIYQSFVYTDKSPYRESFVFPCHRISTAYWPMISCFLPGSNILENRRFTLFVSVHVFMSNQKYIWKSYHAIYSVCRITYRYICMYLCTKNDGGVCLVDDATWQWEACISVAGTFLFGNDSKEAFRCIITKYYNYELDSFVNFQMLFIPFRNYAELTTWYENGQRGESWQKSQRYCGVSDAKYPAAGVLLTPLTTTLTG